MGTSCVGAAMAKIDVDHGRCISCAGCVGVCPVDTITLQELHLVVDSDPCISCSLCIQFCPVGALSPGAEFGGPHTRKLERVRIVA
jgi:ferredoxin